MSNDFNPFDALADLVEGKLGEDTNVVTFKKADPNGIQEATRKTTPAPERSGGNSKGSGPKLADTFKPRKQPKPAATAEGEGAEGTEDSSDDSASE